MIVKFNYYCHDVVISDSERVSCDDPEPKEWTETQFEANCGDVSQSPAGIIGKSMRELGLRVEYIDDGTVY